MDLRELVPAVESVAGPLEALLGDGGSGLTGLAERLEAGDLAGMAGSLGELLNGELGNVLPANNPAASAAGGLNQVQATATARPDGLLAGIDGPLGEIGTLLERLPQIADEIAELASAVDAARHGDLGPLISEAAEALNAILQAATGSDQTAFASWRAYLDVLAGALEEVAAAGGSEDEIRDRLLAYALAQVRDAILGLAPEVSSLAGAAEERLGALLADLPDLATLSTAVQERLQAIATAADPDAAIEDYRTALRALTDTLHEAFDSVDGQFSDPLLTPGAAIEAASRELDRALATRIDDFSDVVGRVEAMFNELEQAVDAVDLSAITGAVDGALGTARDALQAFSPEAVDAELTAAGARVDELIDELGGILLGLTSRLQGWLAEVDEAVAQAVGALGATGPDGRFHLHVEAELEELYARADTFIQGPGSPSLAGTITSLRDELLGLLEEARATATALAGELTAARDAMAGALGTARDEIQAVDPAALMQQAVDALNGAFELIGGLEFDPVVDPVIAELAEGRDALAAIDPSTLNDLLKAGLKALIEGLEAVDFDTAITEALMAELDELLETPRALLRDFGARVDELLEQVRALSPEALLQPVEEQAARIADALQIDVRPALRPLDRAIDDLKAGLQTLDPAQLLQPLEQAHEQLVEGLAQLSPTALLAPAQQGLDELAERIRGLDLDEPLRFAQDVFGDVDRFLAQFDPATLIAPLTAPFEQVEQILDGLRPSVLLAPVTAVLDQIRQYIPDTIPEPLVTQIRALYDEALARADALDPARFAAALQGPLSALQGRFDQLRPQPMLVAAQAGWTQARQAVETLGGPGRDARLATLDSLAPTAAFGAVIGRYETIGGRLTAVADALDPAPLAERYQQARERIEELLPRAIRDDITAGGLRALIRLTDPTEWIARLDTIYTRLTGKLLALSPATLIEPVEDAYNALRATIQALDVGRLAAEVERILGRLAELVDGIDLAEVAAPLETSAARIRSVAGGLDPQPLIDALHERFEHVLALIDLIGLDELGAELQAAVDDVTAQIRDLLDIHQITDPLREVFEAIQDLLGGLDAGVIITALDEKLTKLRDELEQALQRTGRAFSEMLAAAPV
jgi:hypothetical protein